MTVKENWNDGELYGADDQNDIAAQVNQTAGDVEDLMSTINADDLNIVNLEVDNFKDSAVITSTELAGIDSDLVIPTGSAVVDYVAANGGGGGSGNTNLAATLSASQTIITSDTGTDATIPAVDASNAGVMTPTQKSKLDGIEASADVTDAANVNAAGAVMNSDNTTASMSFVIDEDNMASDLATKVPTQQSVKAYVDAHSGGGGGGSGDASTNTSASVDGELAVFLGTGGKTLKRFTGTGILKVTSGVGSTVVEPAGDLVGTDEAQELSHKAIVTRVVQIASHATPPINVDVTDQYEILAQSVAITSMSSGLTGTPNAAQPLVIRIKDNGTARAITWGSAWTAIVALPTTTVANKTIYIGARYNSTSLKWDVLCVQVEP